MCAYIAVCLGWLNKFIEECDINQGSLVGNRLLYRRKKTKVVKPHIAVGAIDVVKLVKGPDVSL